MAKTATHQPGAAGVSPIHHDYACRSHSVDHKGLGSHEAEPEPLFQSTVKERTGHDTFASKVSDLACGLQTLMELVEHDAEALEDLHARPILSTYHRATLLRMAIVSAGMLEDLASKQMDLSA